MLGNFWNQFGIQKDNLFDQHFQDKTPTLEELLEDDTIITEFRNKHAKLMEFMTPQQLLRLVNFISVVPENDSDPKRAFRYPFYSCELLCCDISKVVDGFFPQKDQSDDEGGESVDLMARLLGFVTEDDLNLVLAGYFSKVFVSLAQRRPEALLNSVFANENFLKLIANQVRSRSITEVIIKVLIFDEDLTLNDENKFITQRLQIIDQIFEQLKNNGAADIEIGTNVQAIVQEICLKAYTLQGANVIFNKLLDSFELLIKLATDDSANVSKPASQILVNVLSFCLNDELRDEDSLKLDPQNALNIVAAHYPQILEYFSKEQKILGFTKLKLIELINVIINMSFDSPKRAFSELNFFPALNKLVIEFPFNNLFHLQYHRLVTSLVEQGALEYVFEKNGLVQFLEEITVGVKPEKRNQFRKGYLGFVAKLAKFLEEISQKNPQIKAYLEVDSWHNFKSQFYTKAQQDNEKSLGDFVVNKAQPAEAEYFFDKTSIIEQHAQFLSPQSQTDSNQAQQSPQSGITSTSFFEGFQASNQAATNFGIKNSYKVADFSSGFGDFTTSPQASSGNNDFSWDQPVVFKQSVSITDDSPPLKNEQKQEEEQKQSEIKNDSQQEEETKEEETDVLQTSAHFFYKMKPDNNLADKAFEEFEASL